MQNGTSSADELNARVQRLLDRQDIQDTLSRYSLGQDGHQGKDGNVAQQWDEVFTEDGTVDFSAEGGTVGPYRDLIKWMRGDEKTAGFLTKSYKNWQHMLSLPMITLDGDQAKARTDVLVTQYGRSDQGTALHYSSVGAFHDDLVRTPKGWRIRFRNLELYSGANLQVVPV